MKVIEGSALLIAKKTIQYIVVEPLKEFVPLYQQSELYATTLERLQ